MVADGVMSQSHWRPMLHGLLFGSADPMNFDPPNLTYRIIWPFLSGQGHENYRRLRLGVNGTPHVMPKRPNP